MHYTFGTWRWYHKTSQVWNSGTKYHVVYIYCSTLLIEGASLIFRKSPITCNPPCLIPPPSFNSQEQHRGCSGNWGNCLPWASSHSQFFGYKPMSISMPWKTLPADFCHAKDRPKCVWCVFFPCQLATLPLLEYQILEYVQKTEATSTGSVMANCRNQV